MPTNNLSKTLPSVSLPVTEQGRIPMARQGGRWFVSVESVEAGQEIAKRIDSTLPGANSFHEREAVAKSDPVEPRNLVHVVTDRPRKRVEEAIKGGG